MHSVTKKLTQHSRLSFLFKIAVLGLSSAVLPAHAVTVDLTVAKSWSSGYIVDATVTNDTSTVVNGWTLGFKLGNKIEKMSRATFAGSDPYRVTNLSYSAEILPNTSEPFSFTAIGSFNAANVGDCVFNGAACTLTVNGKPVGGGGASSSSAPSSAAASSKPASSTPASVAASSTPTSVAASSTSASSTPSTGGIPQPPASCSNVGFGIPSGIGLHNIIDSQIDRADFGDVTRWYTENGNVQRFQLHNGDQNQRTSILRPRIEAFAPDQWKRGAWHEFSANYYLSDWDKPQVYAIFQIKASDVSNFMIQGLIDTNGILSIRRRSKGEVDIDSNVFRKPFNLRVRSNGDKFEVYVNCKLVLAENNPQPNLVNDNTQYRFRWGLYRQEADDDIHDGTTTLYVTGPKYN